MVHDALRQKLSALTREMTRLRLNPGCSGNAREYVKHGFQVTTTGMDIAALMPADAV